MKILNNSLSVAVYTIQMSLFSLFLVTFILFSSGCDVLAQSAETLSYDDFELLHIQESQQDYTIDVSYPLTQHQQINEALHQFMSSRIVRFKDDLLETSPSETDKGDNQYVLQARVAFVSEQVLSVRIAESARIGDREALEVVYTFNFNRSTEEDVSLDVLFPEESSYLIILSEISYGELIRDSRMKDVASSHIRDGIQPFTQNFSNFLYDDSGLTFIFNSGQVAPEEKGAIAIHLSNQQLIDNLLYNQKPFEQNFRPSYPIFPITTGSYASEESAYFKLSPEVNDPSHPSSELIKPIALTFDDGPHPQYTEQILTILENHRAKGTFFMIGKRARAFPSVTKAVVAGGHGIGNHTWSHPQLTKLDSIQVMAQIDMTQRIIHKIAGKAPTSVRVPYGRYTPEIQRWINMPLIQWSVDPEDWKTTDPKLIAGRVIEHSKPGSIVLLHDIQKITVDALPLILESLSAKGYTFVTIDELLHLEKNKVYYKRLFDN